MIYAFWLGGWLARPWPVPDWIFSGQNGKLTFSAHVARRGHPYRATGRSLLTTGRQPFEPASLFPAMLQFPLTCFTLRVLRLELRLNLAPETVATPLPIGLATAAQLWVQHDYACGTFLRGHG